MTLDYYMTTKLCLNTLYDALASRKVSYNTILHSDKGSQYRSKVFRSALNKAGIIQSFTSLGHYCDENAAQESFHATLKKEFV